MYNCVRVHIVCFQMLVVLSYGHIDTTPFLRYDPDIVFHRPRYCFFEKGFFFPERRKKALFPRKNPKAFF